MKTFKCPLQIDLAFIMLIRCLEHSTQLDAIFLSEIFLVVVIHQYFLFVYKQIKALIPSVFTPFHYFNCFTPLQHKL